MALAPNNHHADWKELINIEAQSGESVRQGNLAGIRALVDRNIQIYKNLKNKTNQKVAEKA